MAEGLALQIDGKWAVLSDDVSVDIENSSPVWGEGSSFTLPFELDIEPNRHIIGNSDQITGQSVFDVLDGKPAILYTLGIPVYSGIIKLEDEVEITEGKVDISLVSGNLPFNEMIEGMNCQDVELKDEIILGTGLGYAITRVADVPVPYEGTPEEVMWMSVDGESTVNVSKPYPFPYCNTRIQYAKPEEEDGWEPNKTFPELYSAGIKEYNINRFKDYIVLEADRPMSAPCFYVLYFLDCLFNKLGISFDNSGIIKGPSANNDFCRLAFFNTNFSAQKDVGDINLTPSDDGYISIPEEWNLTLPEIQKHYPLFYAFRTEFTKAYYVADAGNFPKVEVKNVIDSLSSAFGVKFLFDVYSKQMKCVFLKDVLSDSSYKEIKGVEIFSAEKNETRTKGFKMMYSNSSEGDTAFNYDEWKRIDNTKSYEEIKKEVKWFNKTLYVSSDTGNAYRVKVNEDATKKEELNPVLMKVGQYNAVEYGDCSEENFVETVKLPFNPIIQNDTTPNEDPTYATLVNATMAYPRVEDVLILAGEWPIMGGVALYSYQYRYFSVLGYRKSDKITRVEDPTFYFENPLQTYDPGLTLGIMRGPGAGAEVKDYEENYDGEGGSKYVTTAANYAFHSDMVDDNGGEFDYNGAEDGGTGSEDGADNRFSLYLRAEKPIGENGELQTLAPPYAKRGLFDKFYTEYAYFVTHRKIVRISCRMEMADILNIDWTKRYHIGQYVGFVNKYNFSVDSRGISNLNLEIYYI